MNPMLDPAALPLRDIHLPAPPSGWPPGPGWLALLGVGLLLAALLLGAAYLRRRRRTSLRYQAGLALQALRIAQLQDPCRQRLLRDLSALLRRVAISVWSPGAAASLCGEDWLRFLDRADPACRFSKGVGRVLAAGPYQPGQAGQAGADFDERALLALTEDWLRRATARGAARLPPAELASRGSGRRIDATARGAAARLPPGRES